MFNVACVWQRICDDDRGTPNRDAHPQEVGAQLIAGKKNLLYSYKLVCLTKNFIQQIISYCQVYAQVLYSSISTANTYISQHA
jgi:hypothetical protein